MVILCSCTKNTNSSSNNGVLPIKTVIQKLGFEEVDNCIYDSYNRLTNYTHVIYDSTNLSDVNPDVYSFSYNGTDSIPVGYTLRTSMYDVNNNLQVSNDFHILFYNAQNQLIKDSCTNNPNVNTANYSYSGNIFVINKTNPVDSFFYSNQNILRQSHTSGLAVTSNYTYTYTNYLNPIYGNPVFVILFGGLNKNSLATITTNTNYAIFSYTLDSNGRVIQSVQTNSDGSVIICTFNY